MPDMTDRLPPLRRDGLQLEEDRAFQRRLWRVQRVAWAIFAAICLLALAGLAGGSGPLQTARIDLPGARIELPRVSRMGGPDQIAVTFLQSGPGAAVSFGPELFDSFSIEGVQPPILPLSLPDGGQSLVPTGADPPRITLEIRATRFGLAPLTFRSGNAAATRRVLILP